MKSVYVQKMDLLETLNKNLELHKKIYNKSISEFKKNYISTLDRYIKKAKEDSEFEMCLNLNKPENHERDYKDAITMVEMSCRNEIELNQNEFNTYVLNRWHWISRFAVSYLSNCSFSPASMSSSSSSTSSPTTEELTTYFNRDVEDFE